MKPDLSTVALIFVSATILLLAITIAGGRIADGPGGLPGLPGPAQDGLRKFASGHDMLEAFKNAASEGQYWALEDGVRSLGASNLAGTPMPAPAAKSAAEYSATNVQVAGVDEADLVKTDGEYIYIISGDSLVIARAYPASAAEKLATVKFSSFNPRELFIDGDRLLVFGTSYEGIRPLEEPAAKGGVEYMPWYPGTTTAKLYDISDRSDPDMLKSFDVEGSYLTSRKIGSDVYFVVNSNPRVYPLDKVADPEDIVPLCRENAAGAEPVARPTDIGYIPDVKATSFTTVASISMADEDRKVVKETVAGSGQNVYASPGSLYIAQVGYRPLYRFDAVQGDRDEKTTIVKFDLDGGKIKSAGTGSVRGHILNQFSMDEHDGYFRIATTIGEVWNSERPSTNNVYVLDGSLDVVGSLEDLAPGEKIYSTRFMGKRCYMVTFKKVDPLFVLDLSDPRHPEMLGKLKIPGYSDYLHPYDETHIIGVGKDAVDASEAETSSRNLDFAWYQGVKMAMFDVSDVENPREMHKELIGDRGTDSPVLSDHKAFLFDRERNLLVLPVTVAEVKGERTSLNQQGEYVFQGAYVYRVDLADGFSLRGKVTHYDDDSAFKKSGYYFYGDRSITRSLYIGDVLYTVSSARLQLNDLDSLEKIKAIDLGGKKDP
jgi:uncharacterized secreted protein with C-terminal beta-propeller domain